MGVDIAISDDGRVEAVHNSGRVLWRRDVDVDAWGESDAPPDLAVSEAIKLFLAEVEDE